MLQAAPYNAVTGATRPRDDPSCPFRIRRERSLLYAQTQCPDTQRDVRGTLHSFSGRWQFLPRAQLGTSSLSGPQDCKPPQGPTLDYYRRDTSPVGCKILSPRVTVSHPTRTPGIALRAGGRVLVPAFPYTMQACKQASKKETEREQRTFGLKPFWLKPCTLLRNPGCTWRGARDHASQHFAAMV